MKRVVGQQIQAAIGHRVDAIGKCFKTAMLEHVRSARRHYQQCVWRKHLQQQAQQRGAYSAQAGQQLQEENDQRITAVTDVQASSGASVRSIYRSLVILSSRPFFRTLSTPLTHLSVY